MSGMNQIKTVILLALLTALLLGVGQMIGGRAGLFIGLTFALIMNFGTYWFSDKIVLKMYKAQPVEESSTLYGVVNEIAQMASIPTPRVYIVPSQIANAFAVGRNYKHSAVAVTQGILDTLNKDELRGVIAHELAHIKNRDTLIATIAATIAGVISYIATMAQWAAIFGGFGGRDDDRGGGAIQLIALAIITPLIATILQLAISRSREYLADSTGAKFTNNPYALASALEKLHLKSREFSLGGSPNPTASLFIVNPFRSGNLVALFSTHPPMEERVRRLRSI